MLTSQQRRKRSAQVVIRPRAHRNGKEKEKEENKGKERERSERKEKEGFTWICNGGLANRDLF